MGHGYLLSPPRPLGRPNTDRKRPNTRSKTPKRPKELHRTVTNFLAYEIWRGPRGAGKSPTRAPGARQHLTAGGPAAWWP